MLSVLMEEGIPNAFLALEMHQIMAGAPYVDVPGHRPVRAMLSSDQPHNPNR
jgi:hypothetical protein